MYVCTYVSKYVCTQIILTMWNERCYSLFEKGNMIRTNNLLIKNPTL